MLYYDDDAELSYHHTDRSVLGGGETFCKFTREQCAKPDGTPRRWLMLHGRRWNLDTAHINNNKFRPLAD